jgi:hypothetical protein
MTIQAVDEAGQMPDVLWTGWWADRKKAMWDRAAAEIGQPNDYGIAASFLHRTVKSGESISFTYDFSVVKKEANDNV